MLKRRQQEAQLRCERITKADRVAIKSDPGSRRNDDTSKYVRTKTNHINICWLELNLGTRKTKRQNRAFGWNLPRNSHRIPVYLPTDGPVQLPFKTASAARLRWRMRQNFTKRSPFEILNRKQPFLWPKHVTHEQTDESSIKLITNTHACSSWDDLKHWITFYCLRRQSYSLLVFEW